MGRVHTVDGYHKQSLVQTWYRYYNLIAIKVVVTESRAAITVDAVVVLDDFHYYYHNHCLLLP